MGGVYLRRDAFQIEVAAEVTTHEDAKPVDHI